MSGPKCQFDEWSDEEKQEALEKMINIAQNGGHQSAMSIALGFKSEDTFYRWKREIPEFKAMCDEAKMHAKAFYENLLLKGGAGCIKGFNTAAIMSIVNAKFADEYKPETTNTNTTNNINILNLNSEEIQYKIAQKIESLRRYGEVYELDGIPDRSSSEE